MSEFDLQVFQCFGILCLNVFQLCTIDTAHTLKCLSVVFREKETRQKVSLSESPSIYNIHLAVKTEKGSLTNV